MARSKDEAVNPAHYASLGKYSAVFVVRAWDAYRRALGFEPLGFCVGNAIKYIQRAGTKSGESEVRDLEKAVWYLQSRINEIDPEKPDPAA